MSSTKSFLNNKITDFVCILLVSVIGVFIMSMFGALVLYIWDFEVQGLFYNFIFGSGIIATLTFFIAICEEFLGGKHV